MKKRLIVFITVAIMLFTASICTFVGCGEDGEKLDYSVTVLGVDGVTAVSDVTVSWQQSGSSKGSAKTNAEGVATAQLVSGEYEVVLSGLDDGLTYPQVTVGASMREVTLPLEVMRVTYTAEVKDKNGAAAKDVTVSWSNGSDIQASVTGEDGKASCELDYGDYIVTVSNLPDGNIFTDAISVTGKNTNAQFELRDGQAAEYSVTVKSEGGLKFKGAAVLVYNSDDIAVYSGKTNENGVVTVALEPGNYTANVTSVQDGYRIAQKANMTRLLRSGEIVLASSVIEEAAPDDKVYKIGDIIHDYKWTTPYEVDGKKITYSIAELLETKEAVVINNWGTKCTYCVQEMPAMEEVYQKYKDKIELLAISNYSGGDSEPVIASYREANDYSFPMMRDNNNFVVRFAITGHPTTIIVDRYGAIAHIEKGGIPDAEIWERLIKRYVGDDYEQNFVPGEDNEPITTEISKPDITVTADHYQKIAAAINGFESSATTDIVWSGETKNDMIWPFILKTEDGVSADKEVLCSPNSGKPNSMSGLYGTVKMPIGKVLTFDYYSECETGCDILSVVWDGKIIKQISGLSDGWKTCHLYTELTTGEHRLALAYVKDSTRDVGKDNVYIRNVRFEDLSAMTESMDMLRAAAYGIPEAKATVFPYYAETEIKDDGYYHVPLDKLENSKYAGNDSSPMLFVNMTGVTNWSNTQSISELVYATDDAGNYSIDCNLTIDGKTRDYRDDIIEYCRIASASDIEGFLPVDKELHDVLVAFTKNAMGDKYHANAWLELCYFYSHYGEGEFVGNPIIGLTTKTAIKAEVDKTITADCTRIMAPFPTVIYAFTPAESAVYKIESFLPAGDEKASQLWLFDDNTDVEHPLEYSGDNRFARDGKNEQNFVVYRYMNAGHTYYIEVALLMQELGKVDFKITNVGQSYTELVPCSEGMFNLILGADGESIIGLELAGAVQYDKDEDGYYHVKNADGTLGDYIYLDVMYPSMVSPTKSMTDLVKEYLKIPQTADYCSYKVFDLRYRIAYYTDEADENVINYDPNFDLTKYGVDGRDYKDYTQIMEDYIASADATGEKAGLVKVDDNIVKLLKLYIEVRLNILLDDEYEEALENEWLRFCWYFKTHDANNP